MTSRRRDGLSGTVIMPGDKSISHRALILGALAVGETRISGLLESEDVEKTAVALREFGVKVNKRDEHEWSVFGVGVGGLAEPPRVIDCGNSGTSARLLMGLMASTDIAATFCGDDSLMSRPMARVLEPLSQIGARWLGRRDKKLPLTLAGTAFPVPINYQTPVPSAQVKSAILLAGLNAPGETIVIEQARTRDHTERMLKAFGADIVVEDCENGCQVILKGQTELTPCEIVIPGDPSSAAFPICAALIVPDSDVMVPTVGMNPSRAALFSILQEMGAQLTVENRRNAGGEPVADLRARFSPNLRGIEVSADVAASMIDEYPILAVTAAFAAGETKMLGVAELRVKESDRIDAMAKALRANGVAVAEGSDWWSVVGMGTSGVPGGSACESKCDHRIAMSCLVLGMAAQNPVTVDDCSPIATSFPRFQSVMNQMGAAIREAQ
ncbi:MAG: 3-phosphoshikimate 1-carboxyvinyltransferase [Aestuariivita sp.]|nr:3-phosphoshikimate 1-carboxyvinyltransferase [Aestuariivita sp.]MCY4346841.1 3-phosphoshikimate 1-carboxyvinyltransferase [Aestuariivita sp.]